MTNSLTKMEYAYKHRGWTVLKKPRFSIRWRRVYFLHFSALLPSYQHFSLKPRTMLRSNLFHLRWQVPFFLSSLFVNFNRRFTLKRETNVTCAARLSANTTSRNVSFFDSYFLDTRRIGTKFQIRWEKHTKFSIQAMLIGIIHYAWYVPRLKICEKSKLQIPPQHRRNVALVSSRQCGAQFPLGSESELDPETVQRESSNEG